ncbi:uncharacterized protein LOC112270072 isoform X2 [Brachypodium distachyon]|uniref:F-box domain-containing protein n=2 Tax=Brachypodium distachyon TaxID=15368 RepID=A0A0Q3NCP0_BRADI|nr:uncharacterized protein LOC112270072 isoform X2 [Brachypodium distachyon]KQK14758.2 hypothetical protein BRADI_1g18426v3 [Brachypodium distachyon]|eukprot:XP_024313502.1 uncharacterized protein LOC112270072 isoform X2 [Brachypodium distachyon]
MHGADGVHFDDGIVGEILLRLPAGSVLRCRAVCTAWRRVADSPELLAAHARRRPLEILQYARTEIWPDDGVRREAASGSGEDFDVHAVAVFSGARRLLARYPVAEKNPMHMSMPYSPLLASCDGLLLLGHGRGYEQRPYASYLVCNPATRQWTELPHLTAGFAAAGEQPGQDAPATLDLRESGFYRHAPSGEYRLLCHVTPSSGQAPYYCVLSAGADEPRRLATTIAHRAGNIYGDLMMPAVLGGRLHWLRHMEAGHTDSMVAFDTAAERFSRMPSPPVAWKTNSRLLVAYGSTLMAAEHGDMVFDLWALEGYTVTGGEAAEGDAMRWVLRHRVEVPWRAHWPTVVYGTEDGSGDVVLGSGYGVVAYNMRSGAARRVVIDDVRESKEERLLLSRRVFRESLVRHGFFDARPHPGLPLFHLF